MGSKTDYLEDKILDHVLRNTAYTSPTTIYLALLTADPTDAGTQTNEVSGSNYAREIITFDAPSPAGTTQNTALVQFDVPSGSWGTVSHWAIVDALTTGNYLYHGAFDSSRAITTSDDVEIPIGAIIVQED
jgi:hypothetical protein